MDCKVTCFDRVLNLVNVLPEESQEYALQLVDKMAEHPDNSIGRPYVMEYLNLLTTRRFDGTDMPLSDERKQTLMDGMRLYDSPKVMADSIIDYEVLIHVLEQTGFDGALDDLYAKAAEQKERKAVDYVYTAYDVALSHLSSLSEEDFEEAVEIIADGSLIDYLDFIEDKMNLPDGELDKTRIYEGIIMWEDYTGNYNEPDYDRLQELYDKTGITKEVFEKISEREEQER